jgi:hypothetical protein
MSGRTARGVRNRARHPDQQHRRRPGGVDREGRPGGPARADRRQRHRGRGDDRAVPARDGHPRARRGRQHRQHGRVRTRAVQRRVRGVEGVRALLHAVAVVGDTRHRRPRGGSQPRCDRDCDETPSAYPESGSPNRWPTPSWPRCAAVPPRSSTAGSTLCRRSCSAGSCPHGQPRGSLGGSSAGNSTRIPAAVRKSSV